MVTSGGAAGLVRAWSRRGAVFDPRRPNNFDLLRFIAATLVLIDHSFVLSGRVGLPGPFHYETLGGFAVAVFFIISGFLVAGSWQRTPELGRYAAKRALRIVPAYAAVIALCALVLGPLVTDLSLGQYFRHSQTWSYFWNLTFFKIHYSLPGVFAGNSFPNAVNGSIWTLPIEIKMYIVLAILGRTGVMTRTGVVVVVAVLAVACFGWGPELAAARPLFIDVLPAYYTAHLGLWFFLGSACWVFRDRIRYRSDVAIVLLLLLWETQGTVAGMLLLHGAMPYLVIWSAQLGVRWMNRFGSHGDFSYGMYLYAFPVQQTLTWLGGAGWPHPAYVAACFVVTLMFAVASWHAVEHPALRLKTRRINPGNGKVPQPGLIPRNMAESGPP